MTGATHATIAADLRDYLRENPGVCANGNVHGWAWIRFHDGDWQATKYYRGADRLKSFVVGEVLEEATVLEWLVSKPITLIPMSEARLWKRAEQTVWEDAAEQDVFADHERCFWCGGSERNHTLTMCETTDDGTVSLCDDCYESWERAGQIVGGVVT